MMKKSLNEVIFTRTITGLLFAAILATQWDVWWHNAIGRDTFWEMPHIFLYSLVGIAILFGIYGHIKFKSKIWRNLAMILFLIPAAGIFDEVWHTIFSKEAVNSILIAWSPPHILIASTFVISFIMLFWMINKKEEDVTAKFLFGAMALAVTLAIGSFLIVPLDPTGPWGLVGFWGTGSFSLLLMSSYLAGQKWLPGVGRASLVSVFIILITSITFGKIDNPNLEIIPHDHPPAFLIVFSLLAGAALMDILKNKNEVIRGLLGALVWSFVLYFFSSTFFEPEFQYTLTNALQAIGSAVVGGLLAGLIFSKIKPVTK